MVGRCAGTERAAAQDRLQRGELAARVGGGSGRGGGQLVHGGGASGEVFRVLHDLGQAAAQAQQRGPLGTGEPALDGQPGAHGLGVLVQSGRQLAGEAGDDLVGPGDRGGGGGQGVG